MKVIMNQKQNEVTLLFAFVLVVALIAITRFTSLKPHWGSLEMRTTSTITVSGTAKQDQNNQIAIFTAGMESIESTKEEALNKTNQAMNQLIEKVKDFGIKEADIQTQSVNVYQDTEYIRMDEPAIEPGVSNSMYPQPEGKARKGDWRASNSVTITLREVDRADGLLAILNNSGANNVYGPNFSLDDSQAASDALLSQAVSNARAKAEEIAKANKQSIGKIINLTESGNYPIYNRYEMMPMASDTKISVDANLEPGSSTTSKSVTVTFELN